ncbi:hypothetical protein [Burkholderia cepacia]|nr:hypothetical protein [Burkholderia cepacia]
MHRTNLFIEQSYVSTVRMLHGLELDVPRRSVWPKLMLYAAQAI